MLRSSSLLGGNTVDAAPYSVSFYTLAISAHHQKPVDDAWRYRTHFLGLVSLAELWYGRFQVGHPVHAPRLLQTENRTPYHSSGHDSRRDELGFMRLRRPRYPRGHLDRRETMKPSNTRS